MNLLVEPEHSPYDLHFQVFGIPVRVHPWFWLCSVILGWSATDRGFEYLLVWVGCVFVSILVHEMGHVLMGQLFGSHGHIVMYSFGGLAIGSNRLSRGWQRFLVSFAGPLAGFVLLGGVLAIDFALMPSANERGMRSPLLMAALGDLIWINLFWGLLNLLPIWPLDGGMMAREFFSWVMPRDGLRFSLGLSALVAGVLTAHYISAAMGRPLIPLLGRGGMFSIIFFGLFTYGSIQLLQQIPPSRRDYDDDDHLPWERQRPEPWERENDSWRR